MSRVQIRSIREHNSITSKNKENMFAYAPSRFISLHCSVWYFIHSSIHSSCPYPKKGKGQLAVMQLCCWTVLSSAVRRTSEKKNKNCLEKHRTTLCCFEVKHLHVQRLPLKTIAFRKWKKLLMQSHFCQPCLENLICLHLGRSMETVPPTRRRVSIA